MSEVSEGKLNLNAGERAYLDELKKGIGIFAELTGSDLFIDCFYDEKEGIVKAHGRPSKGSLYSRNIEGEKVLSENEPMVFYTWKTGITMNDAWAFSQENKVLIQKTMPIRFGGRIIAVLIQERDDTRMFKVSRKLEKIEEAGGSIGYGAEAEGESDGDDSILIREVHHRIKNSLEIISSFLSMQKRQSKSEETVGVLTEDIAKIGSIAAMYDMMSATGSGYINARLVIRSLTDHMNELYKDMPKQVRIRFSGDDVELPAAKMQALVLAVNELVQNAYKHGIPSEDGMIDIHLLKGQNWCAVNVMNRGNKYSADAPDHLGLKIIRALAEEELNGHFSIEGQEDGTTASIQFPL